jgi:EmrB/QacA subfamily drug resistance transporter
MITISTFAGGLMGSSVNIALPVISLELDINAATLPWITTAFFLGSAVILLPGGKAADIIGPRKVFIIGLTMLLIASVCCTLLISGLMLILFRAVQGLGHGLVVTAGPAMVVMSFPAEKRGKALGIYLTSVYVGLTLGPLIGGVMTEHLGWRSLFFLNIPSGLLALFLNWQLRKVKDEGTRDKFDFAGGILSGSAILITIYGLTVLPEIKGILILIGGLILFAIFVWWEKHIEIPLLDMALLGHNRTFIFSNAAALINYSATFALNMLLSLYLQYIMGFSPQITGIIMVILPLVQSIFAPMAGHFSDRFGSRSIATIGMGLNTIGLTMLYFIGNDTTLWYLIIAMVIIGFGLALFVSPNTSAIMSSVPRNSYGVASATQATARQVGIMLSLGIVTVIFAVFIGSVPITQEYYPQFLNSVKITLSIFAALCFAGMFASFARSGSNKS